MKSAVKTYIPAHDRVPAEGAMEQLAPGFFWLRMPLTFELNHINLWLLESASGWSIVDTGFNSPDTVQHWDSLFASIFSKKPVESIFVTHFHPDHFGLAGWLSARTGLKVKMTKGEFGMIRHLTDDDSPALLEKLYRPYYVEAGVEGELLEKLIDKRLLYKKIIHAPPANIDPVWIGAKVILGGKEWQTVGGYGHSPEHACLYNAKDKLFISGDIILPDITPNISFFPGNPPEHDPVDNYLRTLDAIKTVVPDDVTVLPSHGVPFRGLHRRIDEIKAHHDRRLEKLHKVMASGPQTAFQIMSGLFSHRTLKPGDLFFALGETLSHLIHDLMRGKIRKEIKNGVVLYSLTN